MFFFFYFLFFLFLFFLFLFFFFVFLGCVWKEEYTVKDLYNYGTGTGSCSNIHHCLCSVVNVCTETNGLKLNAGDDTGGCQCGATTCTAEKLINNIKIPRKQYCTKEGSSSLASLSAKEGCQKLPWCASANGDVKNQDACKCGDLMDAEECTSTAAGGAGLFCHAASGQCSKTAKKYCSNGDATAINTNGDCICGKNKNICTEKTGMFCNSGQCSKKSTGPWYVYFIDNF